MMARIVRPALLQTAAARASHEPMLIPLRGREISIHPISPDSKIEKDAHHASYS
jgi:hypothetical protein